jgi:hypothetical protein
VIKMTRMEEMLKKRRTKDYDAGEDKPKPVEDVTMKMPKTRGKSSKGNREKEAYLDIRKKMIIINKYEKRAEKITDESEIAPMVKKVDKLLQEIYELQQERFMLKCQKALEKKDEGS